jgi:hypothetical protein
MSGVNEEMDAAKTLRLVVATPGIEANALICGVVLAAFGDRVPADSRAVADERIWIVR